MDDDSGYNEWKIRSTAVPKDTRYMKIMMGSVVDYFRPLDGSDWRTMMLSKDFHKWSPDGIQWYIPDYVQSNQGYGGSRKDWPKDVIEGDVREYISFWGGGSKVAGCCSASICNHYDGENQPFNVSFMLVDGAARKVELHDLVTVTGDTNLHTISWHWKNTADRILENAEYFGSDNGNCSEECNRLLQAKVLCR